MLNRFDLDVQSEERSPVTFEGEYDEVMRAMAEDEPEWGGYQEWSEYVEQLAFEREQEAACVVDTPRGLMFLKRECTHKECTSTRCSKGEYYEGVAI